MLERMSVNEFCYWLQGAIEIGGMKSIDERRAELIYEKLNLVNQLHYFTKATKTILEDYPFEVGFPAIHDELQKFFQHDIDPSYEGDQKLFHAVHRGEVDPFNEKSGS